MTKREMAEPLDCSQMGAWRLMGRLSAMGEAHSGQRESAGIPLTMYPHFSHRSALSLGTAGATRAIGLWYTCNSRKSDSRNAEDDGAKLDHAHAGGRFERLRSA